MFFFPSSFFQDVPFAFGFLQFEYDISCVIFLVLILLDYLKLPVFVSGCLTFILESLLSLLHQIILLLHSHFFWLYVCYSFEIVLLFLNILFCSFLFFPSLSLHFSFRYFHGFIFKFTDFSLIVQFTDEPIKGIPLFVTMFLF